MASSKKTTLSAAAKEAHDRQESYINDIASKKIAFGGLTLGEGFIESIRHLGYKSTGTALNEIVDNAIEATADAVHVAFGYEGASKKPVKLAIIDNGHGMIPGMVKAAVAWGGSDRLGSRKFWGRFGYGLPSACVSQGRSFTVLSRTDDDAFQGVTIDLDGIAAGDYTKDGEIHLPEPSELAVPDWVTDYIAEFFPGGVDAARTIVIMEKLDRLSNAQAAALENHLMEVFGVTYFRQLPEVALAVNGKAVEPVDPLFLTEGARYFDIDTDRAEAEEPVVFAVKDPDTKQVLGEVTVRLSLMPPGFGAIDKTKAASRKNQNPRFRIMKANQGMIVSRAGRQIDVVMRSPDHTFLTYDRNIGIELDFPPTLDDFFGITTAKQQITVDDRIWTLIREHGVWKTYGQLLTRFREMGADEASEWSVDGASEKRPSESVMESVRKLDVVPPPSEARQKEADAAREAAVDKLERLGVERAEAERVIEKEEQERPYRIDVERNPEGPFYRVEMRGGQVAVYLNKAHRFYTDVYATLRGAEGARIRQALEILIFVIGERELQSSPEKATWYRFERGEWSRKLDVGYEELAERLGDSLSESADTAALVEELLEEADEAIAGAEDSED